MPTTSATRAAAAGYYVREGSYRDTHDDRIGRWYWGHTSHPGFRPWGTGHDSAAAAWAAALDHARETGRLSG